VDKGVAFFPDAVTARGTKHLQEMAALARRGTRAVLLFCAQRADAREVRPADHIDPTYGRTLREALAAGVEAFAYGAVVSADGIELVRRLPVVIP
jgi:sugar fermentation stimulation protein A